MKTKTIFFLLLICNLANAQSKRSFLIGGAMGYQYSDDNSKIETINSIQYQEHLIQLNPAAGYFITNWLVAGIGVEYLYDNVKYDNYIYYYSKESGFSIAPFIRFYSPFGLFLHAEFDYGLAKSTYKGRSFPGPTGFIGASDYHSNKNVLGYSAGIGYTIKIKDFFGIEPSVRYISGNFNDKDSEGDFNRKGVLLNIGLVCFLK
jgi:hypothetical protein